MISFFLVNENVPAGRKKWLYCFFLCYIISLFIYHSPVITNALMVCIFFMALLTAAPKNYISCFKNNRLIFGFVLFYLWQCISVFFSANKQDGLNVLAVRFSLLILPLAFCLVDFEMKTWKRILLFYASVTTLASMLGFAFGAYMAVTHHDSGYLYNDNISELLLDKQAVYFGFYVNVAILIFIYAVKSEGELNARQKNSVIAALVWLVFISFMLASKTSIACLLLILFLLAVQHIVIKKKYMEGALLIMGLVVGTILVGKFFPKTFNRFKGITETNFVFENRNRENHFNADYNKDKWNSTNTRTALWQCGMEIWKKNFLFGTGLGDRKQTLKEKYTEKHFWYAIDTEKNLHNQYLDIAVSMGLTGLFIFIFIFFAYPLKIFWKNRQGFSIAVFCCLAISFFTENMLDRFQGEIIIAFILPIAAKVGAQSKNIMLRDSPAYTSQ